MAESLALSHRLFSGPNGDALNDLRSALRTAAKDAGHDGEYAEYEYLDECPRTALVVELEQALRRHGYRIVRTS